MKQWYLLWINYWVEWWHYTHYENLDLLKNWLLNTEWREYKITIEVNVSIKF